jgi:putative endonuclease
MAITPSMSLNDTTSPSTKVSGQLAENQAACHLEKKGLKVLARNFRCRGGEIDLVCRDARTLVFVEVRLRRNASFGGAGGSITATKQRRIILAAQHYLAAHASADCDCRFDCVLLDGNGIEWMRDAFSAD